MEDLKVKTAQDEGRLEHCSFKLVLGDHLSTLQINNDETTLCQVRGY